MKIFTNTLFLFAVTLTQLAATAITFKVDCPVGAPFPAITPGHAMVQMVPMNNKQAGKKPTYGFYPKGNNLFGGAGMVKNDKNRKMDFEITYNVTVKQYNAAAAVINADIGAPPNYHLLNFNCVDWINKVASAAGVALPNFKNLAGINDPNAMWITLDNIGNGGILGAGTVNELAFLGAGNAPNNYSYAGMQADGHGNPQNLANFMGLPSNINDLGNFQRTPDGQFFINLVNITTTDALISVDWGDGSQRDTQSTELNHQFEPGESEVNILIVDHGAVHSFSMTVRDPGGVDPVGAEIFVEDFGESFGENPTDFPDGTPLENDSIMVKEFTIAPSAIGGEPPQLSLSWSSHPDATYAIFQSTDLVDWSIEVIGGIASMGGSTSITIDHPGTDEESLYFRIEEE